jgi:hypothetical protein
MYRVVIFKKKIMRAILALISIFLFFWLVSQSLWFISLAPYLVIFLTECVHYKR